MAELKLEIGTTLVRGELNLVVIEVIEGKGVVVFSGNDSCQYFITPKELPTFKAEQRLLHLSGIDGTDGNAPAEYSIEEMREEVLNERKEEVSRLLQEKGRSEEDAGELIHNLFELSESPQETADRIHNDPSAEQLLAYQPPTGGMSY